MATKKKGILTRWRRNLRDWERVFWKRERKAAQRALKVTAGGDSGPASR